MQLKCHNRTSIYSICRPAINRIEIGGVKAPQCTVENLGNRTRIPQDFVAILAANRTNNYYLFNQ